MYLPPHFQKGGRNVRGTRSCTAYQFEEAEGNSVIHHIGKHEGLRGKRRGGKEEKGRRGGIRMRWEYLDEIQREGMVNEP